MSSEATRTGGVTVTRCTGPDLPALIPDLAALRVAVFRAWPYLYDGDTGYEETYLRTYLRSPSAAVIVARFDGRIVGASTCLPMVDETANVQAPFLAKGWNPAWFFYFGESVLLPELRGRGIGVAFFNEREAHARAVSDCRYACFCGVVRPEGHPSRPDGFVPLDEFWTKRGYTRRPDVTCEMAWTDIGAAAESAKRMVFWMKPLGATPLP
jgi:GNAT superfamily N-acetyltransferase